MSADDLTPQESEAVDRAVQWLTGKATSLSDAPALYPADDGLSDDDRERADAAVRRLYGDGPGER